MKAPITRGFPSLWHDRIRPHFWLKAFGSAAIMTGFFIAYFAVLRQPLGPAFEVPFTWLDSWIGFHPLSIIPYASLWIYVCLPSSVMKDFPALLVHAIGALVLCAVGLFIFLVWPTSTPPVDLDWSRYPGMSLIKSVDAAGNACPSLHAAFAVFAGLWLHRLMRELHAPRWMHAVNWIWALAILYSTIATRQHVAIDTLCGIVLGWMAARLNLRFTPAPHPCSASH